MVRKRKELGPHWLKSIRILEDISVNSIFTLFHRGIIIADNISPIDKIAHMKMHA